MICKSCGKSFDEGGFLDLCEKCWKEDIKRKRGDNHIKGQNEKNKIGKALENCADVILAIIVFMGIGLSIDTNSIYPLIVAIIIGVVEDLFNRAIAEMIHKLQNIENSIINK